MVKVNIGILVFLAGCIILLGLLARHQRGQIDRLLTAGFQVPEEGEEAGAFIYIDSMHPWITSDRPGTCPICGMELIKVSGEKARKMQEAIKSGVAKVSLSPLDRLKANVELVLVEEYELIPELPTYGALVTPENAVHHLTSWVKGRVERFYVQETGAQLGKGARLMDVYSPELVQAQEEFLISIRARDRLAEGGFSNLSENTEKLIESGRRKLDLLGMTDEQIERLETAGEVVDTITVYARRGGLVMDIFITEGMYVKEGSRILEVARLNPIWAELEIYEADIPMVAIGDRVELTAIGLGGEVKVNGPITMLLPEVTGATRTLRVRAVVPNPGMKLRPGMFVEGHVLKKEIETILVVPRDCVLFSGRGARVWVPTTEDPDQYVSRSVKVGRTLGNDGELLEIVSGLRKGQTVIKGAVFLIDSEAELMTAGGVAD